MESKEELTELLNKGLAQLKSGNNVEAVFTFEELLFHSKRSAISLSCLGLAMARCKLDIKAAEMHCREAIQKSPKNADFYFSLAEIYKLQNNRGSEIETLHRGRKVDKKHKGIRRELKALGIRRKTAIPFLSRSNFFNKLVGLLLRKK